MFGSAAMNNLWVTYYIRYFSQRITGPWFYIGQFIYMVWNALNDPIFGWLSDRAPGITKRRLPAIKYGGPLWALVFALAWMDIGTDVQTSSFLAGIHFCVVLCAYDGLLTLVELNHGALMADLGSSLSDRTRLNTASAIGAVFGSFSSFFGHLYWNPADGVPQTSFSRFSAAVALLAAVAFSFSAAKVAVEEKAESAAEKEEKSRLSPSVVARQLYRQHNLGIFTLVSALQVFECTFEKNFLSAFVDLLLGDQPRHVRSMIISTSFILPWLTTVLIGPLINRLGLYPVIRSVMLLKIALSLTVLLLGHGNPLVIGLYAVAARVLTECICRQSPVVLADLVDEDKVLNMRPKTLSAMVMGSNALFTKPGESLAPMLGWAIINSNPAHDPSSPDPELQKLLFRCLVIGPLVVVSAQLLLWSRFTLRGSYLKRIKDMVTARDLEGTAAPSFTDSVNWPAPMQDKGEDAAAKES